MELTKNEKELIYPILACLVEENHYATISEEYSEKIKPIFLKFRKELLGY